MRRFYPLLLTALLSCSGPAATEVNVTNDSSSDWDGKIVAYNADSLSQVLDAAYFVVADDSGKEIPSQLTYDGQLIFRASVKAGDSRSYTVTGSDTIPQYPAVAYGRVFPERDDDMAWENDLVAFRAYGPPLRERGEQGYGYDIFFKRGTTEPVLERFYAGENSKDNFLSYHEDHGYGMDCYAVGATLGAGVTAIMNDGKLIYPWTYETATVLDNGPLRFTVQLDFPPVSIGSDSAVIERRLITLDAGEHLNSTIVRYDGLTSPVKLAAGIVIRDEEGRIKPVEGSRYIAYSDPTQGPDNGRGLMGIVFDEVPDTVYVTTEEAVPHIIGVTEYKPGDLFRYKWGFAWDRTDITTPKEWTEYLSNQ